MTCPICLAELRNGVCPVETPYSIAMHAAVDLCDDYQDDPEGEPCGIYGGDDE